LRGIPARSPRLRSRPTARACWRAATTLAFWDTATGALLRTFEDGRDTEITSAAFSPDGTRVLSGSRDQTVKLWDAATGALLRTFSVHWSPVASVAFSPDSTRVLAGTYDRAIRLWDAASGALLCSFQGHDAGVTSVAFSPDGASALSPQAGRGGRLALVTREARP